MCVARQKHPSIPAAFQESKISPRMAQYIRVPIDVDIQQLFEHTHQVSQIVYRNQRVICIDYDTLTNRIVVHDNDNWFYLTSPDLPNMTMLEALIGLGYGNEQMVVTWADQNQENIVLNSPVSIAPLNQMALYSPNEPVPDVHHPGPFPAVAGQPVPDEPEFGHFQNANGDLVHENNQPDNVHDPDDDDNSTVTYPSSDELDPNEEEEYLH